MTAPPYVGIVLAGGRSRRMGEAGPKALLEVEGSALVTTAVRALPGAEHVVVVGPRDQLDEALAKDWGPRLSQTLEDPPFGGPVAGILAGLEQLAEVSPRAPAVAILACDLPRAPSAVASLLAQGDLSRLVADQGPDGILAEASDGHLEWLLGFYRRAFLTERSRGIDPSGWSVRALVKAGRLVGVPLEGDLADDLDSRADVDEYLARQGKENDG